MYKAITVKYLPPTNTKGSRLKAYDMDGNSATVSYDHGQSKELRYTDAARVLCRKMGWEGELAGGGVRNGYVFVFVEGQPTPTRESGVRHE